MRALALLVAAVLCRSTARDKQGSLEATQDLPVKPAPWAAALTMEQRLDKLLTGIAANATTLETRIFDDELKFAQVKGNTSALLARFSAVAAVVKANSQKAKSLMQTLKNMKNVQSADRQGLEGAQPDVAKILETAKKLRPDILKAYKEVDWGKVGKIKTALAQAKNPLHVNSIDRLLDREKEVLSRLNKMDKKIELAVQNATRTIAKTVLKPPARDLQRMGESVHHVEADLPRDYSM
mmetsp:Transcript_24957/g.60442  ORF Transcript_24957/g.60442 Transcript_24957/m.60442 type:complete len:238 (+) Transcript_24957:3-716(+)